MAKKESKEDGFARIEVDVPDAGDRYPAKIGSIPKPIRAGDIFKDKAKYPERPTLQVGFAGPGGVEGTAAISAPGISPDKIGRASGRGRGESSGVAASL